MKLDFNQPKRKKKDPLKSLITTATVGYAAYKILNSNNKKRVRQQKMIDKKQEKTPFWFWCFLALLILAGIAEISK